MLTNIQFRKKRPELKLEAELKDALEREPMAESTSENLISKVWRRRFLVLSIVSVLNAATLLAAARLDSGLLHGLRQTDELLRRAGQARDSQVGSNTPGTPQPFEAQGDAVMKKMAA